jgi:GDP-L-fucose synthase
VDISIGELARLIGKISGYGGRLVFDTTKPDGMPQKLLDVSAMQKLGWAPRVSLEEGLRKTCEWYAQGTAGSRGEKA